ncbi:MAG TPA: hypothetical protein V6D28_22130 [Leptolyngbyaceae cyanobacterium]
MKLTKSYVLRISAIALFLGGMTSLAVGFLSAGSVTVTNISEVQTQRDDDARVYVKGKVVNQVPLLELRAYQLQDSTGTILVVTKDKFPPKDKELLIKGKVEYQSIPLGGQELGEVYLKEEKRL